MRKLTILAFVVPSLIIFIFAYKTHQRIDTVEQKQAIAINKWKTDTFVKISSFNFSDLDPEIDRIASLSSDQKSNLQQCINGLLKAYSTTSPESFFKFRFPVAPDTQNSDWDSNSLAGIDDFLSLSVPYDRLSANALNVYTELYTAATSPKGILINGQTVRYCRGCLDLFVPNSLRLFVTTDRVGATWLCDTINTTGEAPTKTLFYSIHEYEMFANKNARITKCTVKLIVKASGSDTPFPLYLEVGWDAKNRKWLPYELGSGLASSDIPNLFF